MSSVHKTRRTKKTVPAPAVHLTAPAEFWPAWTDNWYYEPGEGAHDLADHVHIAIPEPGETDAEFLARIELDELTERARIESEYHPLPEDLQEYSLWSAGLLDGTLAPSMASRFTLGEYDAYRRGQPTDDELGQLASHGCI
jgi:hypothetical protein